MTTVRQSRIWLLEALRSQDQPLATRVEQVRAEVSNSLQHVTRFFPHFPSHGVDHSDRIAAQLSKLLAIEGQLVLQLSTAELYCLCCAIYVHDLGMVVSEAEAAAIVESDDWKKFTGTDPEGRARYEQYGALLASCRRGDDGGLFACALAMRRLIASFVRREHHKRSALVLETHPYLRNWLDCGDPVVFETIADISLAHGLDAAGLVDERRYPERRTVLGDEVNVRFLARLLRMGDLLDMDTDRAPPFAEAMAAPLAADSTPYWRQYSTKKHELVAPDKIAFTFHCKDQETHRILRDWLGMLQTEVEATGLEQLRSKRHASWLPPECKVVSLSSGDLETVPAPGTIIIRPAADAVYQFHEWKLELDQGRILDRLINDVYDSPRVFVRELIQNALDATRCQMYRDFEDSFPGRDAAPSPTEFDVVLRQSYPLRLSLGQEDVTPAPDLNPERKWVLEVEDSGTGMTEHIIKNYFLQIGRSYYQSREFRERFDFIPTSRFGVGFLSVFAVSNDVTVETAHQDDVHATGRGLRMRLRGATSYLLTESWEPFQERPTARRHGTRIRVVLEDQLQDKTLLELVQAWCVNVEFPVLVEEGERKSEVHPTRLVDGQVLAGDCGDSNGWFVQRVFELAAPGVEGQLAVCAYVDSNGEGWCDCWSRELDLAGNRLVSQPTLPGSRVALHGIGVFHYSEAYRQYAALWFHVVDVRSPQAVPSMSRRSIRPREARHPDFSAGDSSSSDLVTTAIEPTAEKAVESHLRDSSRARAADAPHYVGRVLTLAPVSSNWRNQYPGTVVTWRSQRRVDCSLDELLTLDPISIAYSAYLDREKPGPMDVSKADSAWPIVSLADLPSFGEAHVSQIMEPRRVLDIVRQDDVWLVSFGSNPSEPCLDRAFPDKPWWLASLGTSKPSVIRPYIGVPADKMWSVLNRDTPIVAWLLRLSDAAEPVGGSLDPDAVRAAWNVAAEDPWEFSEILARWATDIGVPPALRPPTDLRLFYTLPNPRPTI
jgi:molecular chaperone HtpG